MKSLPDGFELISITEGDGATPAAEIQFAGQRLCILRESLQGVAEIEFVEDKYLGTEVQMRFPLESFKQVVVLANQELSAWSKNIRSGNAQQAAQETTRPKGRAS